MIKFDHIYCITELSKARYAMIRLTFIAVTTLLLQGCFLDVFSTNGRVISDSGNCDSGCEILDTKFTDRFTAIPNAGYQFSHWRSGDGFLCAESDSPVCPLSNTTFSGNATADSFIASNARLKIEPIFIPIEEPPLYGSPYAIDANNEIVGHITNFTRSGGEEEIWVATKFPGLDFAYWVRVREDDGKPESGKVLPSIGVAYSGIDCSGDVLVSVTPESDLQPLSMPPLRAGQNGVYIPNPSASFPTTDAFAFSYWAPSSSSCNNYTNPFPGRFVDGVTVEFDYQHPVRIVFR